MHLSFRHHAAALTLRARRHDMAKTSPSLISWPTQEGCYPGLLVIAAILGHARRPRELGKQYETLHDMCMHGCSW